MEVFMSHDEDRNYEDVDVFQFLEIDPDDIIEEWIDFPSRYMEIQQHCHQAGAAFDRAKEALDYADSELDREIRSRPEDFGLGRVTDTSLKAAQCLDPRHADAADAVIEARRIWNHLRGAVNAMEAKKKALECLHYDIGRTMRSEPKARSESKGDVERQNHTAIRGRMKKRARRSEESGPDFEM